MAFADVNGQQLSYEDSGGDGPAVVMMHGFLMDRTMFDPQVADLADAYRCICFDARGFGDTGWDGKPFGVYDMVADCVGLMDHLGLASAHVVGMSMGGYTAIRLALRHPDRVDRMVLIGSRHRSDPEDTRNQYRGAADVWQTAGPVPPLVEGLMSAIIGPRETCGPLWDVWTPKWLAVPGANYAAATEALVTRDDITDEQLSTIGHPTLVVHGEEDSIPISNAESAAALLPNCAGLVRVAGGAHSVNLTHPQVVDPPLRAFLDATG